MYAYSFGGAGVDDKKKTLQKKNALILKKEAKRKIVHPVDNTCAPFDHLTAGSFPSFPLRRLNYTASLSLVRILPTASHMQYTELPYMCFSVLFYGSSWHLNFLH